MSRRSTPPCIATGEGRANAPCRPATLFYLDPPYFGTEGDYGPELFDRGDFAALAEALAGLSGRFILSLNDHPEVRRIFARFTLSAVPTTYVVGGGAKAKSVSELIITNCPK